jgi:hypothetical protein
MPPKADDFVFGDSKSAGRMSGRPALIQAMVRNRPLADLYNDFPLNRRGGGLNPPRPT